MNKKGISTIQLFLFIFVAFLGILFLGLAMWGFDLVNDALSQDVEVGQVNMLNVTNSTFGQLNTAFLDLGDSLGIILILSMAVFMFINAYFLGKRIPKLFIVLDIFILIFAFLLSVYISQSYELVINSSSILSIYGDNLPKSSAFILNLPLYVGIIGVLIMIFTYAGLRKSTPDLEEQFSEGVYEE